MKNLDLAITCFTTVCALGTGRVAMIKALQSNQSGLVAQTIPGCSDTTYLGKVSGLDDVEIPQHLTAFDCRNNRLAEVTLLADDFIGSVDQAKKQFGANRIAVVLGTSTSGASTGEEAYAQQDEHSQFPSSFDYAHTQELSSLSSYVRERLGLTGLSYTISTACSSSTKSFADAALLISTGLADAVVVGGVDTLCGSSIRGFYGLELLSPTPCCPNDVTSRGISIGEAGGFALLQRRNENTDIQLLGFGESTDAYHMSSPHPEGLGAEIAIQKALEMSGLNPNQIDYVNLHGTGSAANDQIEDKVITKILGTQVPVSSTKGWTGHTLGAAGIIDSAICFLALEHSLIFGNLNLSTKNPAFQSNIVKHTYDHPLQTVMTNNFGFGGNNCTLIFGQAS